MSFRESLISGDMSVLEAMRVLDENNGKVLFVVADGKLAGAVSDGDIRRWIMRAGALDAPVRKLANFKPKYIKESQRSSARDLMLRYHIGAIPVVNDELEILDIAYIYEPDAQDKPRGSMDLPVVIMAGGMGTRLYPYTKILPKPLIPIGDIPITEHIINHFQRFGCHEFYLVVNHKKNMIKAYFNEIEKDYSITYIDEDQPLGTGGGVGLLRGHIHSTFILTNCDTLIEEDFNKIVKEHREKQNAVTMICSLKNFDIPYGVVEIGENGAIAAMREKPHMAFFTNTGSYVVEPDVIELIEPGRAIGFPDVIQSAKNSGLNVGVFPVSEKAWMDMGQFDTMEEMRARLERDK